MTYVTPICDFFTVSFRSLALEQNTPLQKQRNVREDRKLAINCLMFKHIKTRANISQCCFCWRRTSWKLKNYLKLSTKQYCSSVVATSSSTSMLLALTRPVVVASLAVSRLGIPVSVQLDRLRQSIRMGTIRRRCRCRTYSKVIIATCNMTLHLYDFQCCPEECRT